MQYSYRWLKELSGTKQSPVQLARLLLTHAFEVEGIEPFAHGLEGIVVGEVVNLSPHPEADKLRVARVKVGREAFRQIVCGAPNVAVGQRVAVALPGASLAGGIRIGVAKLRGVESHGMLCSARELGLGDDENGILVLPPEAPLGVLLVKYLGLDDTLMEIKVLPDRGSDALAYQGMAREIAALDGHAPPFAIIAPRAKSSPKTRTSHRVPRVVLQDKEGCRRYMGLLIKNVRVEASPLWLRIRLLIAGIVPHNNIVDLTHYLMLLTGQPLHAYDAAKVAGPVSVRKAKQNERITLLTGALKRLTPSDIVIADDEKILALAGVMGAKHARITDDTRDVFLEIANFDAATIRRTRTRHGLATDASYRFERGLDPDLPAVAFRELQNLLPPLTVGKVVGSRDLYPHEAKPWKIRLPLDLAKRVLGTEIALFEAVQFLALLGLRVKKVAAQEVVEVTVPTRRPDLRDEWNLIEEIGRLRGYEKIAPSAPHLPLSPLPKNPAKAFERQAKEYLTHAGFDELIQYAFYGDKEIRGASLPRERHAALANPLSPEQGFLRLALAPLLVRKTKENLRNFSRFDLFEWGSIFTRDPKTQKVTETKSLALVTVIEQKSQSGEAFFALKGRVLAFFEALWIETAGLEWVFPANVARLPLLAMFHPTRSAVLTVAGRPIGIIGEPHPHTLRAFGLEPRLALAEFDVDALRKLRRAERAFAPFAKFPAALRDISLTFPQTSHSSVMVAQVEALLHEAGAPLLRSSELFDIYTIDGEKSFAFHLAFGAPDRTLSREEIDGTFNRIVSVAQERLGGRLRLDH